jgi:hypothetical protein
VPTEVRVVYVDVLPKPPEAVPPTQDDFDRLDSAFRAADWIDSSDVRYGYSREATPGRFVVPIARSEALSLEEIRSRVEAIGEKETSHLALRVYPQEDVRIDWQKR